MTFIKNLRFKIHKTFGWPYRLKTYVYGNEDAPTAVLLHGINNSSKNWLPTISSIKRPAHILSIDLLGFGASPKPENIKYTTQDHLKSINYTINKQTAREPFVLVGHSMGAILAVEYAHTHPERVSELILCSFPYYKNKDLTEGIKAKWAKIAGKTLYSVYSWVRNHPDPTLRSAKLAKHITPAGVEINLTKEGWTPFVESLKNTIEKQDLTTHFDNLKMPIHIISGKLDPVIIATNINQLVASHKNISSHTVTTGHDLTPLFSKRIASIIDSILRLREPAIKTKQERKEK